MAEKAIPRRASKKDLANNLLQKLEQWQEKGDTPSQAIEKLSLEQYDFLIEYGINLDNMILSSAQQKAITTLKKTERPIGLKYNKLYPQAKQNLFNVIADCIKSQGANIVPREKQNYRDLDFELNGVNYKIVLSNPRPPKNT